MLDRVSALHALIGLCESNASEHVLRFNISTLVAHDASFSALLPPQLQVLWRSPEIKRRQYNPRAEVPALRRAASDLERRSLAVSP